MLLTMVRFQLKLKMVYWKLGVARQSQLVRLVVTAGAPGAPLPESTGDEPSSDPD
jgi:hypothetical protein